MYGLTPFSRNNYDIFNLFSDFDRNFFGERSSVCSCRTDIRDDGDKYVLESELPGFDKSDISLDINGSYLVISADRSSDSGDKDEKGSYIRRERSFGSYKRSFDISDVNAEQINAEYKNGILTVDLPKKKREEPAVRRLEIN